MFQISVNPAIHDKPASWDPDYAHGWQNVEVDADGLKQLIADGTAFIPAAMTSGHRSSAAFKHADLAVVDVDAGLSLEGFAAHPLAQQALMLYTTASHSEEEGHHRFRVIFRLSERIFDGNLFKALTSLLIKALGGDKSCSDPCRLFYGNSQGTQQILNPEATLAASFINEAQAAARDLERRFNSRTDNYDELTIQQASFVLEEILDPTSDGERDHFIRVTAAVASSGDILYPQWADWASRGHHGKGKNSRQVSERFFRGFSGNSSLATLFFLAGQQDPEWRKRLPDELRGSHDNYSIPAAGYAHEDFLGEEDDLLLPDCTDAAATPAPAAKATPSLFDASGHNWADLNQAPVAEDKALPDLDDFDLDDFDDSDDPLRRSRKKGGKKGGDGERTIPEIKARILKVFPGLRLNQATLQLEYGPRSSPGIIKDPTLAWVPISESAGELYPKTIIADILATMGEANPYNPIKAYLEYCASNSKPVDYFDRLASTLLGVPEEGTENPLMPCGNLYADVVLKRFLVGAVARALNPGCPHGWMPILIGPQNLGKSNFFQYLTPRDQLTGAYPWVPTVQQGIGYIKDRPHTLHAGWIVLLDEAERYFKRQYTEELKNLVTVAVDRSARKFENEKSFPRAFVMAGATNNRTLFQDPTGNRRFMPVNVLGRIPSPEDPSIKIIDLDRVKADRNAIWAAAYKEYLDNPVHEFSSYELSCLAEYSASHMVDTPLREAVEKALERNSSFIWQGQTCYTTADLFKWLEIGLEQANKVTIPLSDVMRQLGYVNVQKRVLGQKKRFWCKPD